MTSLSIKEKTDKINELNNNLKNLFNANASKVQQSLVNKYSLQLLNSIFIGLKFWNEKSNTKSINIGIIFQINLKSIV